MILFWMSHARTTDVSLMAIVSHSHTHSGIPGRYEEYYSQIITVSVTDLGEGIC